MGQNTVSAFKKRLRKSSPKQRIFIIVLVVALAAGIGLWQTNTVQAPGGSKPSDQSQAEALNPSGYKEYKNETLGVRFAYPQEWGEVNLRSAPRYLAATTEPVYYFNFTAQPRALGYFPDGEARIRLRQVGMPETQDLTYVGFIYSFGIDNNTKTVCFRTAVIGARCDFSKKALEYEGKPVIRMIDGPYKGSGIMVRARTSPLPTDEKPDPRIGEFFERIYGLTHDDTANKKAWGVVSFDPASTHNSNLYLEWSTPDAQNPDTTDTTVQQILGSVRALKDL